MISIVIGSALVAFLGAREWNKSKKLSMPIPDITGKGGDERKESSNSIKDVDLVEFLKNVDSGKYVIPELIETEDWFRCDTHKISVVKNEGNGVAVCLHLPNYVESSEKRKIADYMRSLSDWRRSLPFAGSREVELQVTFNAEDEDGEETTYIQVVPAEITERFADDRDPSGANRMYESMVRTYSKDHKEAEKAISDFIGADAELKYIELVVKVSFRDIDNETLYKILKTPLEIFDRDGNGLGTDNILFCSSLGSFYDLIEDENGNVTVQDYLMTYSD